MSQKFEKEINPLVIARHTDPDTSHEAADRFDKDRAARSVRTVIAILSASPTPMSDFDIRDVWATHWKGHWSFTLPGKARHWARQAGLVRHAGHNQHEGRRVKTWELGQETAPLKPSLKEEVVALRRKVTAAKGMADAIKDFVANNWEHKELVASLVVWQEVEKT